MNVAEQSRPGTAGDDNLWLLDADTRSPWLRSYLGNGLLAAQLVAEGAIAGPHGAPLHLMAQLYDRAVDREVEHPAPLPGWSGLHLEVDGVLLRSEAAEGYRQTLDLRHGLARTEHRWTIDGISVEAVTEQATLRQEPNLALIVLTVRAGAPCRLTITAAFAPPPIVALRDQQAGARDGRLYLAARTLERGIPLAMAAALWCEDQRAEDLGAELQLHVTLTPDQPRTVCWLVAVHSGYTTQEPEAAARVDLERGRELGAERLLAGHRTAWERLWAADIVVDGDPEVQRFVRAGLYGLLSSARHDVPASISPMGLSSLGYNGHIFWDADTWMYPALLLLHPDLARGMLTYRRQRLPAARERARAEGYRGLMFPWESATDGTEQTPSYANTGLKEHHITACVALAHWQYFLVTEERGWLAEHAWPVIEGAARFWVSRVTPDSRGGYAIRDVICADEYAEDVDNNAFTNAAARAALRAAVDAAAELGREAPLEWTRVAEGLVLPLDGDLVLEYDGYDGRTIKQADVELLTYPLEHPLTAASIARNLDTYQRVTDPEGPAMGRSISAIVAAQLGRREEALALFKGSYAPNLFGPFYSLAETPTNGAVNFLTGAGGALQALLFGVAGLRLHRAAIGVDPLLPAGWHALRLPIIHWRGRTLRIEVHPGDRLHVALDGAGPEWVLQRWRMGSAEPLTVEVRGAEGAEIVVTAEEWRVEPQFGAEPSWWIYPPTGGALRPYLRLRLHARTPDGQEVQLEIEQRITDGDA